MRRTQKRLRKEAAQWLCVLTQSDWRPEPEQFAAFLAWLRTSSDRTYTMLRIAHAHGELEGIVAIADTVQIDIEEALVALECTLLGKVPALRMLRAAVYWYHTIDCGELTPEKVQHFHRWVSASPDHIEQLNKIAVGELASRSTQYNPPTKSWIRTQIERTSPASSTLH